MTIAARHPRDRVEARAQALRPWRRAALVAVPIIGALSLLGVAMHANYAPAQPALVIAIPPKASATGASAAIPDLSSPGTGTTGTIALPPEPTAGRSAALEAGVTAARPFRTGGIAALDRGRALECLAAAIYYEAASESDDGQRAVAQVVLNRVRHPAFPATVCGVVYQGSEQASGCQFSFACDGAMARQLSRSGWARALRIAAGALAGQVYAPVGLATHYHTYAVTPAWNRTLVMTDAVGAHFFHRWKGYWGTAAAFTRNYRGGEPVPGPHQRDISPATIAQVLATGAPAAAPVALAAAIAPAPKATPSTMVQPAYVAASTLRPEAATDAAQDSQILDKWKDSGKPRE